MSADPDLPELEEAIGYRFSERDLLERALTHRSFANERGGASDNERLEFLGDAVVGLVVGAELMSRYTELKEGSLSATRAEVVSERGLAKAARRVELGRWLRLGRGEEGSGGRDKPSLLADVFEALAGAVYCDGGYDSARGVVLRLLADELSSVDPSVARRDHKTRLQEMAQAELGTTPHYEVVGEEGPDHSKTFSVRVMVGERELGTGTGRSKKAAEQQAAEAALAALESSAG